MDFDAATLAARAPDAIIYADSTGKIRFWNEGATRIFGFSPDEAVGQSLDLIIPEQLRARHWEGFERTVATGVSRYGVGELLSVPARRKDGTRISVEFTITPFKGNDGGIAGIGATMRDVSARFQETRALKREVEAWRDRPAGKRPRPDMPDS